MYFLQITLDNPSTKPLTYRALLRGESASQFSIVGVSETITVSTLTCISTTGAFLEKSSGGSSSRAEGPHPLYIAHAHITPVMLRIIVHIAQ